MKTLIPSAALLALTALGCDDTADAIDHRADKERAELRAEVEQLKADLRSAESKMAAQAASIAHRAQETSQETKEAARDTSNAVPKRFSRWATPLKSALTRQTRPLPTKFAAMTEAIVWSI